MTKKPEPTREDFHRRCAKELFNRVWTLLETADRSPEQVDEMIHASHASRHHWGQVGGPLQFARGEWQIARVYAALHRAEPAMFHARRCLAWCRSGHLGAFDHAYAHEAIARAAALQGDGQEVRKALAHSQTHAREIEKDHDRQMLLDDLRSIPGFVELVS